MAKPSTEPKPMPALEPLPPRPEDDPNIIGEALAIVRRGKKFQLISVRVTPDMPHRVIEEIASDSGIVASGRMIHEIKKRMMRIGLLKAPRVEDMKNTLVMPTK